MYVNRQSTGRRLLDQDHEALVAALEELGRKYDYEVIVASMESMSKFDQIYLSSRTTVCLLPLLLVEHLSHPTIVRLCSVSMGMASLLLFG